MSFHRKIFLPSVTRCKTNLQRVLLLVLCILPWCPSRAAAQSSYSLAGSQTTPIARAQTSRDTCWAFAGVAALEAAYNRKYGMNLRLSEQYTFHMLKAMELQPRTPENNTSLAGFQGSSDIIMHLTRFAIPEARFAPYLTGVEMERLRLKLNVGDIVKNPTQTGYDTFEFSEEHIPTIARWNARYRVTDYGEISNPTDPSELERVLRDNHEIAADFTLKWKFNPETDTYEYDANGSPVGHVMLIIGYDQDEDVFLVRNWGGEDHYIRMTYECMKKCITGAYYIKDVAGQNDPPQKQARYLGFRDFEAVYNNFPIKGWLVIRRFTNLRSNDPNARTKLGSLYTEQGLLDVYGYFTDNGDGVVLDINLGPEPSAASLQVVYPFGFWAYVDASYPGPVEKGTEGQPFRSFGVAMANVPKYGEIIARPGTYAATGSYNKPVTIKASAGGVILK
jgi:hypothetical protein